MPIVIHDNYLKRLCGVDNYLSNYNYNETNLLKLKNYEKLPTLSEILSIVDGNTPILIELKKLSETQNHKFFKSEFYSLLKKYLGPLALMSFDLKLINYLSKKLPNIQRGLVLESYDYTNNIFSSNVENRITERQIQKNAISFVSFEYSKLTKEFYNINKTKKRNVIAWTINSEFDARRKKNFFDNMTFEGFKPI